MKVIKLELFQERTHFREPKILNTNLITSLPLPPPTTLAGMLVYIYGKRFREPVDISVIGKFKNIQTDLQRIEKSEWKESYIKKEQSKKGRFQKTGDPKYNSYENFLEYKSRKGLQNISSFEVLNDLNLTVFIKHSSEDTLMELLESLKEPSYYPSLGRKEDYVEIKNVEIVEIRENVDISLKESIEKDFLLKNTYVPFDIRATDEYHDTISDIGTLYVFPRIYKDIRQQKQERKYLHSHYMHIGENSCYLPGTFNIYKNTIFKWLVNIEELS